MDGYDFTGLAGGASYSWMSKVAVLSLSPMVAVKLGEAVSVGAAINFNHGVFNLKKPAGTSVYPPQIDGQVAAGLADLGQYEETMNGWSFGATFGLLVRPIEDLSVGLTVRTPSTMSFNGSALLLLGVPLRPAGHLRPGAGHAVAALDRRRCFVPAVRAPAPECRRPLDPVVRARRADDGLSRHPRLGRPGRGRRTGRHRLRLQDTTQIRFGAEYTLDPTTALRAGYYLDPAPGPESTLNVLLPTHTFESFRSASERPSATSSSISAWSNGGPRGWLLIPRTPCPGPTGPRWSCRRSRSRTSSSIP